MNCPTCNLEHTEVFKGLIDGKPMSDTLANFCRRCGMDLRPYHEKILKESNLKSLPHD